MANVSPLSQLRDIHLPDAVSWWPPAVGWYGLLCVGIVFIVLAMRVAWRIHSRVKPKRQALKLLSQYRSHFVMHANVSLTCARVSELLKRVALTYFPRQQVAGLTGKAWIDFLSQTSKGCDFFAVTEELLELPYHTVDTPRDLEPLFKLASQWIKQRSTK